MPAVAVIDTTNKRVRLTITGPTGADYYYVTRVAGTSTEVRSAYPTTNISAGVSVVDDYEIPRDVPVYYIVRVDSETGTIITSNTITYSSNGEVSLVHPGLPSLSRTVNVNSDAEYTYGSRTSVFQAFNADIAVAWTTTLMAPEGHLTIYSFSPGESRDIYALLRTGQPLFLAAPADWMDPGYIAITGLSRVKTQPTDPRETFQRWEIDFIYVSRPSGYLAVSWTYDELGGDYATVADVNAAYNSYNAILFNEPGL